MTAQRKQTKIQHLHAMKKPIHFEEIIALDIETASDGSLLDIGVSSRFSYGTFPDWKSFFQWLKTYPWETDVRVAAHHGFGFDYVGMIQYLLNNLEEQEIGDQDLQFLSSEALVIAVILRIGERKITFIDTMRFFPGQSLNNVAKDFLGETKHDVPDGYISRMEDYRRDHKDDYYRYLRQDCELLRRVYEAFRERVNEIQPIGELGLSSGSTALKCFRRHMASDNFFIFACPEDLQPSADAAMRGGLTLYVGDGIEKNHVYEDVYHYDVISMYPSVMRYIPVPTSPLEVVRKITRPKTKNERYAPGWYLCDFEQTRGRVPVLYGVDDDDPSFTGQGILSHFDMEFLRRFGIINKIYDAVIYTDYVHPFGAYLDEQLEGRVAAKREGRKAESAALKVLLNSLYGKFAQKARREQMAITSDHDWYDTRIAAQVAARGRSNVIEYYHSEKVILYGAESDSTSFSNRFIGAMVTSLARLKLGTLYNTVPTIYCDTDSLFTQRELPEIFIGENPGDFEHCDDSPARMICAGKKSYLYNDAIMFKGIPKNLITAQDMIAIKNGAEIKKEYRSPTALKTALKNGVENPNQFLPHTRTIRQTKSMKCQGKLKLDRKLFSTKEAADFLQFILR